MPRLIPVFALTVLLAGPLAACDSASGPVHATGSATGADTAWAIADEAGPIQIDDGGVPVIRMGLWEVRERTHDAETSHYRECMTSWHEASRERFELGKGCPKDQSRTDKRLTVTETCRLGGKAITSVHTYTGSDTTFVIGTENKAGVLSTGSRIEARWLGPCPRDMGRGDTRPLD